MINDFGMIGMILTEEMDERVEKMCNFSEGVWEDGKAEGKAEGLANLMHNISLPIERAMEVLGIPLDERGKYEQLIASIPRN